MDVLDMTLENVTLFNAVVPAYDDEDDNEIIRADNPKNKDEVARILGLKRN